MVDQVRYEITSNTRFADATRIKEFITGNTHLVGVFNTAVGQAAASRRATGEPRQPGQGEAAIAEFLQRVEEVTGDPDSPVLLLYEDSDVRKGTFVLPPNMHVVRPGVSCWGWNDAVSFRPARPCGTGSPPLDGTRPTA